MILGILVLQFFLLSIQAVGGASAILPEIHRVFVDNLHLMTDTDFNNLFALSQASPGPNVLFIGLFGLQMAGFTGAFLSLLSFCGPTLLLSVAVEHFGTRYHDHRVHVALRKSLSPISIGLLMSTSVHLVKSSSSYWSIVLTVACIVALLRFRLNPLILIAVGAGLGASGII